MKEGFIYSTINCLKIPSFFRMINGRYTPIIAYHGIYDGPRQKQTLPPTFIHIGDFKEQIKFFRSHYDILDPNKFLFFLANNKNLPPNCLLITFDDGYESFSRLAEPFLRSLEIKPLVFLPTRYINDQIPFWFDVVWSLLQSDEIVRYLVKPLHLHFDDLSVHRIRERIMGKFKRLRPEIRDPLIEELSKKYAIPKANLDLSYPMRWSSILETANYGTVFGSHTHSHTILSILTKEEVRSELNMSKKIIEGKLNCPCLTFAYPNGALGDFDSRDREILSSLGFKASFSLKQELTIPKQNSFDIPRICVAPEDTTKSLALRCSAYTKDFKKIIQFVSGKKEQQPEA